MAAEARIARHPTAVWRDTPSSLLVLAPDDAVVRLQGAGRELWLALDEPATVAELAAELAGGAPGPADADDDAPDPTADVGRFVSDLRSLGLVVDVVA